MMPASISGADSPVTMRVLDEMTAGSPASAVASTGLGTMGNTLRLSRPRVDAVPDATRAESCRPSRDWSERVERHREIRKALGDDRAPDESPQGVVDVPDVDVHRGRDQAGAQPEGDELPARGLAAHHDLVVGIRVPDILHTEVELVGEEVGHPVVRLARREDRLGCEAPLPDRVVPVLDAQRGAEDGVARRGDIARCEHVGVARTQVLVDEDPTPVELEPRRCGKLRARNGTDADDDEVRGDLPLGGAHSRDATVLPDEARHDGLGAHVNAVAVVQIHEVLRESRAEDPPEWERRRLEHGHLATERARGSSQLEADPAAPDNDESYPGTERFLEGARVRGAAQGAHPLEVRSGHVDRASRGSRREHDAL